MTSYRLDCRDDTGEWASHSIDAPTAAAAVAAIPSAIEGELDPTDYGRAPGQPFRLAVDWTLRVRSGRGWREIEEGTEEVEIEGDVAEVIADAFGARSAAAKCDHSWEHGGVFGLGGTGLISSKQCTRCGVDVADHCTGSQHNPGESDTIAVSEPYATDLIGRARWELAEAADVGIDGEGFARLFEAIFEGAPDADDDAPRLVLNNVIESRDEAERILAAL